MKTQKNNPALPPAAAPNRSAFRLMEAYEDYLKLRLLEQYRKKGAGSQWLLQVGADSAQTLIRLAALSDLADLRFTGAAPSKNITTKARRIVREAGLAKRIRFVKDEIHDSQFETDSFDLVVSRFAIQWWKEPVRALNEIHRILKAGGVAILHELRQDAPPVALAKLERAGLPLGDLARKLTLAEAQSLVAQAGLSGTVKTFGEGQGAPCFEIIFEKAGFGRSRL